LIALLVVPGSAAAGPTPSVGDRAPEFEFQGSDGELYTLKGLLSGGKRGIVLAFFPKAFTPG
jgi:peroxiredoxin